MTRWAPAGKMLRAGGLMIAYGVLGGLLVAGAALPEAAVAAVAVGATGGTYAMLPADLRQPRTAQTSVVYAADGHTPITAFYDENRQDAALAQVAPAMRQAIVAAEDTRFYEHGAVDLRGLARALVVDVRGDRPSQGASTLTMQYVRNVLKEAPDLSSAQRTAATADTLGRKVREILYAEGLEQRLSKSEILDRYLNIAYFGAGAYGIQAASRTYFDVPPGRLSLPQAALLAGLVRSPDTDNPISGDRAVALARRAYVLAAMTRAGDITAAQAASAGAAPLGLRPGPDPHGCVDLPAGADGWGYFCDYLRRWWEAQPAFGATVAQRDRALDQGGYTIVASLRPDVQAAAQRAALSVYGYRSRRALPIAVVEPGTGRILAMAVNRHFSLAPNPRGRSYPNTVDQLVAGGGGVIGYPSGSTFKLFTMLAALSSGLPLSTAFDAPGRLVTRWPASGPGACGDRWCPVNANPSWMDGHRTMWTGYGRSVNTYFVWLEEQVGPRAAVSMARRLGIEFRAPSDARMAAHPDGWGSFTLGVAATTPLDLADAYATVAAGGVYCKPLPVVSVTDRFGHPVPIGPDCHQAVDPDVAAAAADAARCPVGEQSAYGACDGATAPMVAGIVRGRPVGGKTGSSEWNSTETFVGFTPQVAAAGIAADPADPGDRVGAGVAPEVDAAVARTLARALRGLPYLDFPTPPQRLAGRE
jgi:membrane peptidoglycan carboxypeptidase